VSDDRLRLLERAIEEQDFRAAVSLAREHVRTLGPGHLVKLSAVALKVTNLQRAGKCSEEFAGLIIGAFDDYRRSSEVAPPYNGVPTMPCPTCAHHHIARRCPCGCEGPDHLR
jgi:hypothetical protein